MVAINEKWFSSGGVVEAYDNDVYGNTLIFTGPTSVNNWFGDDDVQSTFGANEIILCGHWYDAETQNYYERFRNYSPSLAVWTSQDPAGFINGANTYQYVTSSPVGNVDAAGTQVYMYGVGLSNTPTAPPPAPGVYVYNVESFQAFGFHQVVVVVGPNGHSDAASFAPANGWALFGPGVVYPDNNGNYWETYEKFLFLSGFAYEASAELKRYLNSSIGRKSYYNVVNNNCRDFSQGEFNKLKTMYNELLAHALNRAQHQILKPLIPVFPNLGNPILSVGSA